ncbi:thermonuclease family protein [Methanothrix soehngenii]|jgi:endonuclease YncB( thermonuclease family)|uniref:thermonuclease family protein n=1 Tax=Methanothrix soehngenii TaxID=2223 RepID=UPI002CFB2730|nr:thermonuclease family protein [Rectinema sp.]
MAMRPTKPIFVLPLFLLIVFLLIVLVAGTPDEAVGRVTKVIDGDTFDVQLQDSSLYEDLIRVRLADIDCPETRGSKACEAGKNASAYTRSWLLSTYIFLDLDDKTGKDQYDRWVAVAYLSEDGVPGRNFNKMLVDAGHADIKDFENDEFNPETWWS